MCLQIASITNTVNGDFLILEGQKDGVTRSGGRGCAREARTVLSGGVTERLYKRACPPIGWSEGP